MTGTAAALADSVFEAVSDRSRVRTREIDRAAVAADASHYLLTPRAVIIADSTAEVAAILRAASRAGQPLTFRSGGTSLSGQASTSELLVDTRRHFRRIEVHDEGRRVRVQPGATVRQVNAALRPYGRRLGPDPASEAACTIGGVVADNSSGMACGIDENTYRTLESMIFVLPSGTTIDTAEIDADTRLRHEEPELHRGLLRLRDRVRENPESIALIARQFAMKNTMGYGVNAFIDFDTPVDILAHLIVGSEGTLAFVAEAVFRTVPIASHVTTALAVFPTLDAATSALPDLVSSSAGTLELMDARSLRVAQSSPDAPAGLRGLDVSAQAALLVEYHAESAAELDELASRGARLLSRQPLVTPASLSTDPAARAGAWKVRKGIYAAVAGARPPGTTALLEDVVVPVERLAATCAGLDRLFVRFGYDESVIFGHAKDGNIHFMISDRLDSPAALGRLEAFTDAMADLVLGAGGNLKAEHGTGRAMAPFVRRQYGPELHEVMRELKRLCDPTGILNPGVIIEDDPGAHLQHIKVTPEVESEVDRCVECGYCEPVCPSKDLTLTPRQRIVVRRAITRARESGDEALAAEIDRDYDYAGVSTCAVDGMCATACPVLINTGDLVRRLRREGASRLPSLGWRAAAAVWGPATRAGAIALSAARRMPDAATAVTRGMRRMAGAEHVPEYAADLPSGGAARRPLASRRGATGAVLYLPACVNSMFGPSRGGGIGVTRAFLRLAERAGIAITVPDGIESMCCGTPWSSKGYASGHAVVASRATAAVARAVAEAGADVRVLTDASSCTEGYLKLLADVDVVVEDVVAFTAREILPRLGPVPAVVSSLMLHPTCSSTQLGLDGSLSEVAGVVAERVLTPQSWGCCAFAGDRGMLHPELTAAATADEAEEVRRAAATAHASCNRTCEIGMTRATGREYRHVIELLEEATRSRA